MPRVGEDQECPYLVGEVLLKTNGGLLLDLVWDLGVSSSVAYALSVFVLHDGLIVDLYSFGGVREEWNCLYW